MKIFKTRYALLLSFITIFVSLSLVLRILFVSWSWTPAALSVGDLVTVLAKGFVYDLVTSLFLSFLYMIYLFVLPKRWNNSLFNRIVTYVLFSLLVVLCMFSFFAEVTFWKEFESRFNFIAVDYLVYTYEVINNINQSYPLPKLIGGMLLFSAAIVFFLEARKVFSHTFKGKDSWRTRIRFLLPLIVLTILLGSIVNNQWTDHDNNKYKNELSKAGIFSFFAALRSNELNYDEFYKLHDIRDNFSAVRKELTEADIKFTGDALSIQREVKDSLPSARKPNVIMVTIESLSADFMAHFGNKQSLMPVLDSLADKSILFTDMYATGTRTVRGMEALTLAIPPTPGNSIVRRANNDQLYCVGSVFKQAGYTTTFFYGGDGYFDNMNAFFGNNGFDIVDRGSSISPGERFTGTRTRIADKYVHFENAWGISDEDLYDAVVRHADEQYKSGKPFYDFVMTTSNHRPYTYPKDRIDIPSGTGREGAVKYTDYAIGRFLQTVRDKPWFNNTIIIFVADHCASVAGRNQINVEHYHIPCILYNLRENSPMAIPQTCSQIDLYPTLFGLMNWSYRSNFYGKNVLPPSYTPRAFVATYQQLGYLSHDSLVILGPQKKVDLFSYNKATNEQIALPADSTLVAKAVGYYQSAYYLFKHNGLKEKTVLLR